MAVSVDWGSYLCVCLCVALLVLCVGVLVTMTSLFGVYSRPPEFGELPNRYE